MIKKTPRDAVCVPFLSISAFCGKIKRRGGHSADGTRRRGRAAGGKWGNFAVIYITGDTHGELDRFRSPEMKKLGTGDTLLVCGDFGFLWDGGAAERKNLRRLGSRKYTVAFVDGTHENFDLLGTYPVVDWNGGKARHISGNLYHLLRGRIYTIEGKKIFTFGGGESEEKQLRIEAGKWWPCEMPSSAEIRGGLESLKAAGFAVDYIVTHEPPPGVDAARGPAGTAALNPLEVFFARVARETSYKKWFSGARHIDRKVTYRHYSVFERVLPVEEPPARRTLFRR